MAWTAPMTAVANAVFTAAQFNANVRDNLLETMPGKATTAGRWFVTSAANTIAERVISRATVDTSETTSSTTYADLATSGPAVTVTTSQRAIVFVSAQMSNATAGTETYVSHAVSGASSISANDEWAAVATSGAGESQRFSCCMFHTGLTAGSNTFTMKYRNSAANTGTFLRRTIVVMAL